MKKIIARSALVLLFAASYTNTGCAVVRRVQEAGELFLRLLAQAAADGFIHIYEEKEQPA